MNNIVLNSTIVKKNKVIYNYSFSKNIKDYFNNEEFFIEFDVDINKVPLSILNIPFVCNMLPIAWLLNAKIEVETLDTNFYNCVPNIKQSYKNMYPMLNFNGDLFVKDICKNSYSVESNAVMFSGGIDATATLIKHLDLKPLLINLQGSDIGLDNFDVLEVVKKRLKSLSNQFSLPIHFIRTSFRKILNEKKLDDIIRSTNDNYWHALQHGIGILGHTAPLSFVKHIGMIYIASSYTKDDNAKCASDPSIDNLLRMASTSVYHDNYELTRGEKIDLIGKFCKTNNLELNIRVCFNEKKINNCCKCEKCYRTIFEIISRGYNPKSLGFTLPQNFLKKARFNFSYKIIFNPSVIVLWKKIQNQFLKDEKLKNDLSYKWFIDFNFETSNNFVKLFYKEFSILIKNVIKKMRRKYGKKL